MVAFYDKYVSLCNSVNKSPSGVALEIGLSKTAVNGWKHGRSNPTDATKQKIADYFGCTLEALTAEKEQKEKPALSNENELSAVQKEAINFIRSLSDEQLSRFIKMGQAAFEGDDT